MAQLSTAQGYIYYVVARMLAMPTDKDTDKKFVTHYILFDVLHNEIDITFLFMQQYYVIFQVDLLS